MVLRAVDVNFRVMHVVVGRCDVFVWKKKAQGSLQGEDRR
jgi:hypothetical protein